MKKFFKSKKSIFGVQVADWLLVALGLAVFVTITLLTITKFSIWFDEAFGAYLIRFNFWDIAKYTAADVHPPLYYWLLKLWSMLFGTSELALRSMSTLFGGVSIVFGYLLVNKLFNKKAAQISLIFMALSPMLVRYGQEARMYTLVTAIALAATYVLTFAINSKRRLPWVIYGILVGLGMWVHYFSAIVWIAHWVWRVDNIRRSAGKGQFIKMFFRKEWILAHIVAIGIFLPWLPFMAIQMTVVQAFGFWIPQVTPATIINFLTNVVYYLDIGKVTGWLTLGFLAVVILLVVLAIRVYKSQNKLDRQSYRLIIALAFVPMLILFFASMPPLRSSFVDRYLIPSAFGIALFIGITLSLGIKFIRPKSQTITIALVAGLMIIGISNVYQLGNYNKNSNASNSTRQIIEAATKKSSVGQTIVAATPWLFYEAAFYSTTDSTVYYIAPSDYPYGSLKMLKDNDQFKIKDINAFAKANKTFWYVGYSTEGKLNAPCSNLEAIQEVLVNDTVSGKPAYKAIQYKIINN